jgi:hypothetical protein
LAKLISSNGYNKISYLFLESRPISVNATNFRQLACDIDWDNNALISVFRWGLRDDVKYLLLNLPDPLTLTEAIT